jgi:hypothetical protein
MVPGSAAFVADRQATSLDRVSGSNPRPPPLRRTHLRRREIPVDDDTKHSFFVVLNFGKFRQIRT